MVDVDGVIIRHPAGQRWDARLVEDLGIDPLALQERFFRVHFDEVTAGRADLFDRLALVLPELGPVTGRELVDYWFSHDATLDAQLLADLADARAGGMQLHLATVQDPNRARYLWTELKLAEHFHAMHYSADVGYGKTDPGFYRVVESRTQLPAGGHCLIDDSLANVEAARSQGWQAHLWTTDSRLADVLQP